MRPLKEKTERRIWKVLPKHASITQLANDGEQPLPNPIPGKTFFTFDKTFSEDTDTSGVYESTAKGIVSSVLEGMNGTIFAYGQTSSGKTFTMQGAGTIQDASGGGGIVHMAARDIFQHVQQSSEASRTFTVKASFLEIYNEEVRDLLSPGGNEPLAIRQDKKRGIFVQSVERSATDMDGLMEILFEGEKSRAVASTGMNERSSRSHTIFRVTVESQSKVGADVGKENQGSSTPGTVRIATLDLVDLAGSESVRHTGATGDRQKEGGMINQR
jgi:centromeric protein E